MEERLEEQKANADKGELLLWACARGLLPDVTALLGEGVDPELRDKKGLRAVHYAAAKGHVDILKYLGARGADVDAEDESGRAPLHYAATWGHADVVQYLVQKGAWVDATDSRDDTPLHLASRAGHTGVVSVLLDTQAKHALQNKRHLTAFGEALVAEHMATVDVLAARAGVQLHAGNKFTLLHVVAGLGKSAAVEWLLKRAEGRELVNHAANVDRTTPLHAAVLGGDSTCVQLLLSHGAKKELEDAAGRTASELLQASGLDQGSKDKLLAALGSSSSKQRSRSAPDGPAASGQAANVGSSKERLEQCMRQVDGLCRKKEAELQHLEAPVRKAVLQVQALGNMVECYSALLTMRTDEGFREDVSAPEVRAALEQVLRGKPNQHADDPRVVSVLGKLRKLQSILTQHGRVKVTIDDLLTEPNPPEEQKKLAVMRSSLQAAREAAARALAGDTLEEIQGDTLQEIQPESETETPEKLPDAEELEMSQQPQGSLLDRLGKELVAQLLQAAVICAVLLLVLWATGRLPWQSSSWWEQRLVPMSVPQAQVQPPLVQQVVPGAREHPDFDAREL